MKIWRKHNLLQPFVHHSWHTDAGPADGSGRGSHQAAAVCFEVVQQGGIRIGSLKTFCVRFGDVAVEARGHDATAAKIDHHP